jgi:hypothetical protein
MQTTTIQFNSSNIYVLVQLPSGQLQRQHKYKEMTITIQNNRRKGDKNKERKQSINWIKGQS